VAERTAIIPQSHDPVFVDDLIRQLRIEGKLGVLNVSDTIVPIYLLGQTTQLAFTVQDPFYAAGQVFTEGEQTNPAAAFVLADTTALPAGTYDIVLTGMLTLAAGLRFDFQHRNAANAANINEWVFRTAGESVRYRLSLAIAENERFRVLNQATPGAGEIVQWSIEAKVR